MDQQLEKVKNASIKFNCPECKEEVDIQDAYTEEKLGSGIESVSLICPHCQNKTVGYYSNPKIRKNIVRLKQIRERRDLEAFQKLQQKHIKYFDKFQSKMREGETD